jgi:prefoldin subunit 4
LNNKLLELQADMKQFTMDVEKLEDGASELMMVTDDKVMLFIGESFIECSEEYATEYCENKAEVGHCCKPVCNRSTKGHTPSR